MHRIGMVAVGVVGCLAIGAVAFWQSTGVTEVRVNTTAPGSQLPVAAPSSQDWPWWRGARADGHSAGTMYPVEWASAENVLWKISLTGTGHGSPCIWGEQVFLHSAEVSGEHVTHRLQSFARSTGQLNWTCEVATGVCPEINAKNSQASATPACDGERVFVTFVTDGTLWTAAVDTHGKLLWKTAAGPYESKHGYGSSPALHGSLVIVAADNKGARIDRLVGSSFLAAMNRETGKVVWRIKRPAVDSYGTPVVGPVAGRDQLLLAGYESVDSYDPATGEPLWQCRWGGVSAASTIAFDREQVYVSTTEGESTVLAIRADGTGDVTASHVAWQSKRGATYVPTPLVHDGLVYLVTDGGVMTCLDTADGKEVWKKRLGGDFSASPVLADGLIYATNEAGKVFVVRAGREYDLLAENDFQEASFATPVLCGGQLFHRTTQSLLCLSGRGTSQEHRVGALPER